MSCTDPQYGEKIEWSLLHYTCSSGKIEFLKYLVLEKKVDINIKDVIGNTPFDIAKIFKKEDFLIHLVPERDFSKVIDLHKEIQSLKLSNERKDDEISKLLYLKSYIEKLQINDYIPLQNVTFENSIKKGGFGTIFKSEMKMAAKKILINETEYEIFEKEVNFLKKAQNKNIVKYHGYSKDDLYYYIFLGIMDSDLSYLIYERKIGLTDNQILYIAKEIAEGMNFLHSNKIVHRDLKPENILISNIDTTISVRICDFGISKEKETNNFYSYTFLPSGTILYMVSL